MVMIFCDHEFSFLPSHRAATTGSTGFISLLVHPPEGVATKPRLNTGDRVGKWFVGEQRDSTSDRGADSKVDLSLIADHRSSGNTPLHLAMESAHAEAAVLLIEAGADRERVRTKYICFCRRRG